MAKGSNPAAPAARHLIVLVATRKGAWLLHGDPQRRDWRIDGPHFLGHIIHHMVLDPRDGGVSWQRFDSGLPGEQAWWTVKRQAMTADTFDPVGLYFGTTSGELWASHDEGGHWRCIARHLPEIYAVEAAEPAPGD